MLKNELLIAIIQYNYTKIEQLITSGTNINFTEGIYKTSPLWLAISLEQENTVKLLLDYGADVSTRDYCSQTLLHFASHKLNYNIVKMLLDAGADLNALDQGKYPPLSSLLMRTNSGNVEKVVDIIKLMIDNNADVNFADLHGNTPLHIALGVYDPILTRKGPELAVINAMFLENGKNILKSLIDAGADIEIKNTFGHTAISLLEPHSRSYIDEELPKDFLDILKILNSDDSITINSLLYGTTSDEEGWE